MYVQLVVLLFCSFWEQSYEEELLQNRVTMNLLYVQAVSDLDRGWLIASKEQHKQLDQLQSRGSKKEVQYNTCMLHSVLAT